LGSLPRAGNSARSSNRRRTGCSIAPQTRINRVTSSPPTRRPRSPRGRDLNLPADHFRNCAAVGVAHGGAIGKHACDIDRRRARVAPSAPPRDHRGDATEGIRHIGKFGMNAPRKGNVPLAKPAERAGVCSTRCRSSSSSCRSVFPAACRRRHRPGAGAFIAVKNLHAARRQQQGAIAFDQRERSKSSVSCEEI